MRMIPEIFAGKLIEKLYAKTVFGEISNTWYEGEIKKQGDVVHIRAMPSITIREHKSGGSLVYERPESTGVDLSIDQGAYWAFEEDDPDSVQTDLKGYINIWAEAASTEMKVYIDKIVLAGIVADVHESNKGSTAGVISANIDLGTSGGTSLTLSNSDIVDKIMYAEQVLDEQNVPNEDRWIILPAWAKTRLNLSDLKNASITGDAKSPLRNGKIEGVQIGKFTPYISNQLSRAADGSANTCTNILFGQKMGITFATQMVKNQMNIVNTESFGMRHRGLQVYGYKVIKPEAVGVMFARAA